MKKRLWLAAASLLALTALAMGTIYAVTEPGWEAPRPTEARAAAPAPAAAAPGAAPAWPFWSSAPSQPSEPLAPAPGAYVPRELAAPPVVVAPGDEQARADGLEEVRMRRRFAQLEAMNRRTAERLAGR